MMQKLLTQQRENLTGLREATQADVDAGLATKGGGDVKILIQLPCPTKLEQVEHTI